jgi:hypothetical protein
MREYYINIVMVVLQIDIVSKRLSLNPKQINTPSQFDGRLTIVNYASWYDT